MRLKRGSNINFFNKDGEWLSEIIFLDRDRVEVKFLNKLKESTKNSNIELAILLSQERSNGYYFTKSHRAWCYQNHTNYI
jgi:16S rRNA U1498 N3-methylase RsmE